MRIDYVKMSDRIRKRRKELGMKQKDLAEKAGLSISYVSRLEHMEGFSPSVRTVIKLANALDVSLFWIVGIDDLKGESE